MLTMGILLISIVGQIMYAANREEKRLTRQYPSYNKRARKVRQKAHRVTVNLNTEDFKSNPRELVRYKLEKAVEGGNLPVESATLVEQIHGLKRNHSYVSAVSNSSSVGTKIAPVELEEPVPVVFHADLAPTPPAAPAVCSCCVIL